MRAMPGAKRRLKPVRSTGDGVPARSAKKASISPSWPSSIASGFSTKTCFPARSAASASDACVSWRVVMSTTSTSLSEDLGDVGGRVRRAASDPDRLRIGAGAARDAAQLEGVVQLREVRQVHGFREAARANERDAKPPSPAAGGRGELDRVRDRDVRRGVAERDQKWLRPGGAEEGVGGRRLVDREAARLDAGEADNAAPEEIEVLLEVPLLRPAHVRQRVVEAFDLVLRVVAAWAVRGGDEEVELLLVHVGPAQVQPDVADEDNTALLPARLHGIVDDLAARRRGRDDDGVGAEAVGELVDPLDERRGRGVHPVIEARASRCGHARRIDVGAHDATAVRLEQLDGELADDPEADDADRLAQRR